MKYKEGDELMIRTEPGRGHALFLLTPVRVLMPGFTPDSLLVIGTENNLQQIVKEDDLMSLEELKAIVIDANLKRCL